MTSTNRAKESGIRQVRSRRAIRSALRRRVSLLSWYAERPAPHGRAQ